MKIISLIKEKINFVFLKIFFLATSIFLFFLTPLNVIAQTGNFTDLKSGGFGLNATATAVGLPSQPIQTTVGKIINTALGLLGIVAVILIIYAGFLWMTAGGTEDRVKKAKDILTASVIGLIIILASYAIANFVVGSIINSSA